MRIRKRRFFSLTLVLLAGASLMSHVVADATDSPRIHPKKIELLHGVVTGTRTVPAYAEALGASTSPVGDLSCLGGDKIKDSVIFRVETVSRYFDMLKWCNGYGNPSRWDRWEQLQVGEAIVFRVVERPVHLSVPRCEDLGLLSEAQAQRALDLLGGGYKIYRSHCTYSVTEAYVKAPDERWIFRIVDSGPRSEAKNRQVGASYSESLAPPW